MYKLLTFVIFGLLVISPQLMALDTNGLVGAWLLDDGKGNTVKDSSDNELNGQIAKGAPTWVKGKFGGAMEFGGSDMVTVQDNPALDLKSFTISAWVNIPAITNKWQIIASKETSQSDRPKLRHIWPCKHRCHPLLFHNRQLEIF